MKVLSRDFTLQEKLLMLVLALLLLGLGYYYMVDQPVRREIARCESEKAALQTELTALQSKLHTLETMKEELENIEASGDESVMMSYNASKDEIKLLNDVLARTNQYSVSFINVTRDKDQIRRNFTLTFVAYDYETMADILTELTESKLRCRIADIQCSRNSRYTHTSEAPYVVRATATFFETMVGGTPDAGLPETKK